MQKQIEQLLEQYKDVQFSHNEDKDMFFAMLKKISLEIVDEEKLEEFLNIIEYSFIKYSEFDTEILYNPFELFDAIIDNNLDGEKIDSDDSDEIIKSFTEFEKYLQGKIDDVTFLQETYGVKIYLLDSDIASINAGIFGRGLNDMGKIIIIKKLKKLIELYPITFIKNIKLDTIFVARSFYKQDEYGVKTELGGFKSGSDDNIYLTSRNLVESFDHELYHQAMKHYDDYSKWKSIRKNQNKFYLYKDLYKEVKGFARNYGKENISEDQATVAEEIIMNYNSLTFRLENDKILEKKVDLVKKAYFDLSDGIMDELFFKSIGGK